MSSDRSYEGKTVGQQKYAVIEYCNSFDALWGKTRIGSLGLAGRGGEERTPDVCRGATSPPERGRDAGNTADRSNERTTLPCRDTNPSVDSSGSGRVPHA